MAAPDRPLSGTKVVVFAGLGPVLYASMLLADMGCEVTIVDRVQESPASMPAAVDPRRRGQRSIALDLRTPDGSALCERLVGTCDVVIEGMRPGVVDRLGFGPSRCQELNPNLVYVHMTGWGQTGPNAPMAGHDINYIASTGALHAMGSPDAPPAVPLNLLGDYAGGSTFAVMGILAALIERTRSGRGQVIDAAIVDGVASLCTATLGMRAAGLWHGRGENVFDGSRPWYRTYETADGEYVAVGAIEPKFYAAMLRGLDLDPSAWPRETAEDAERLTVRLTETFRSRTRAHWAEVFGGTDACVTPVLSFAEAATDAHLAARETIALELRGAGPAPRLSRTPLATDGAPAGIGADTDAILVELGIGDEELTRLRADGVVR